MDITSISKTSTDFLNEEHKEDLSELSVVEALSDLVSVMLTYHKISSSDDEKEYARKTLWYLVNKWLELIAPLKHISGLTVEVSKSIKKKLWDQENIDIDLIREILVTTYIIQKTDPSIYGRREIEEYSNLVRELLDKLGYVGGNIVIDDILDSNNLEELVSLVAIIITLSTNY